MDDRTYVSTHATTDYAGQMPIEIFVSVLVTVALGVTGWVVQFVIRRSDKTQAQRDSEQTTDYPALDNWVAYTLCCFCDETGPQSGRQLSVEDLNQVSIHLICLQDDSRKFDHTRTKLSFETSVAIHLANLDVIEPYRHAEGEVYQLSPTGLRNLQQLYDDHSELLRKTTVKLHKRNRRHDPSSIDVLYPWPDEVTNFRTHVVRVCEGSDSVSPASSSSSDLEVPVSEAERPRQFRLRKKYSEMTEYLEASGYMRDSEELRGGFLVTKGSRARKQERPSIAAELQNERHGLRKNGVLKDVGEFYEFTCDYPFRSPSLAASVVLGGRSNGLAEWTDAYDEKQSLGDVIRSSRRHTEQGQDPSREDHPNEDTKVLYGMTSGELVAYGYPAPDGSGFYVRISSRANVNDKGNLEDRARRIRQDLIDRGKMVPDPEDERFYVFKDDHKIEARKLAAARNLARSVVLGYRAPKKEWQRVGGLE